MKLFQHRRLSAPAHTASANSQWKFSEQSLSCQAQFECELRALWYAFYLVYFSECIRIPPWMTNDTVIQNSDVIYPLSKVSPYQMLHSGHFSFFLISGGNQGQAVMRFLTVQITHTKILSCKNDFVSTKGKHKDMFLVFCVISTQYQ